MISLRTSAALAGLLILLLGLAGCDLFGSDDDSDPDPELSLEPGTFSAVVQGAVEEELEGIAAFSLDAGPFREPVFLLNLTTMPEASAGEVGHVATAPAPGGIAFYRFQQEIPPAGTYDLARGALESPETFGAPEDVYAFYFAMPEPEAGTMPVLFDAVSGTLTIAQAGEERLGGAFEFVAASAPSGPIGSAEAADTVRVSGTFDATFLEVP